MAENKSVFETLNVIDCSDKIEKKNGLSYLSWSFAWGELLKKYPTATYKVYENNEGWNYFTDGRTCWVKTGVTVEGKENIEYLPVMDFRNKSIPANAVTSFDVNKAIQRSLTKAIARHGLGLYIYAGEDLPESDDKSNVKPTNYTSKTPAAKTTEAPNPANEKEAKDLAVKIEQYSDMLSDDQKQKIDKAVKESNVKYLSSILSWCAQKVGA